MQQQHQKAINTQPQENQVQLNDLTDITPLPWTVESQRDTEGGYIIREARHEQLSWCDEGYDISDEEGERRSLVAIRRNSNNMRLIEAAPSLFAALRMLLTFPDIGRAQAIKLMDNISPHWREIKITGNENEVPRSGTS